MTKHVEPTKPIETVPAVERVIEKPTMTAEQLQHQVNAKVLRQTAHVLQRTGWCTGRVGQTGHPHCVLGAIGEAAGLWDLHEGEEDYIYFQVPAAQALGRHVADQHAEYASSSTVIRWNDHGNNVDKVIATLHLVAHQEEQAAR